MRFSAFLKFLIVIALVAAGVGVILVDVGVNIPLLKYQNAEAHGVPIGIGVLVVAVAVARLWKITHQAHYVDTYETRAPDGTVTSVRRESDYITRVSPPPSPDKKL
ncbi:MAG TPA: hypothetical protein VF266_26710 [Thermoanaerobaculia bacterium]